MDGESTDSSGLFTDIQKDSKTNDDGGVPSAKREREKRGWRELTSYQGLPEKIGVNINSIVWYGR
jgi:hypothetical protein